MVKYSLHPQRESMSENRQSQLEERIVYCSTMLSWNKIIKHYKKGVHVQWTCLGMVMTYFSVTYMNVFCNIYHGIYECKTKIYLILSNTILSHLIQHYFVVYFKGILKVLQLSGDHHNRKTNSQASFLELINMKDVCN